MKVIHTIDALRAQLPTTSTRIFVPTMGSLHEGHLNLVHRAQQQDATTIVSIFVNPLQFGPNEDFARYPRTLEKDLTLLETAKVDYVFAPSQTDFYPEVQQFFIQPPTTLADRLEGESRPGFFTGVCTVVMKLFQCIQPQFAVFGKKDYQQQIIIRQMCRQFSLPIEIIVQNTVRAQDGLALSSRNQYLSHAERLKAPQLYQALQQTAQRIQQGARAFTEMEHHAIATLCEQDWQVDYFSIRHQHDLSPAQPDSQHAYVVLAAAKLGKTRLIDNLEIKN